MSGAEILPSASTRSRSHPTSGSSSGADEHQREAADLARLDQRQRLEQLVERAEAAREDDERRRVAHEHHLAREEVVEAQRPVDPGVLRLLERQVDREPDRQRPDLARALVGGRHDPAAAAGDDREAGAAEPSGDVARVLVLGIVRMRARRTEDRHAVLDVLERLEAHLQLAPHAPDPHRVGGDRGVALVEQLLVGRARRGLVLGSQVLGVGHASRVSQDGRYARLRRKPGGAPGRGGCQGP